jgi:hypothetical protein
MIKRQDAETEPGDGAPGVKMPVAWGFEGHLARTTESSFEG